MLGIAFGVLPEEEKEEEKQAVLMQR